MNGPCSRSLACLLALSVANVALPPAAHSTLISTEQFAQTSASPERVRLDALLARPDIQAELVKRGVSADEARERVAALTDQEASGLASRLDQLAAGSSDVLGAVLVVFIVLLITDILGFTKVFSFTRPAK